MRSLPLVLGAAATTACAAQPTTVSGTIVAREAPAPAGYDDRLDTIEITLADNSGGTPTTRSLGLGGHFEIDNVEPGTYHVHVAALHQVVLGDPERLGEGDSGYFRVDGPVELGDVVVEWTALD